jgi:hypothetical protein
VEARKSQEQAREVEQAQCEEGVDTPYNLIQLERT